MANKVGNLIKEARTGAGMTQEALARKVDGVTASDIGKAERGEKELTQAALKQIAKATGITQSSLLEAAKSSSGKKASTAKKASSTAKKTTSTAKKTSMQLTAAEKKLVELYRDADTDTRKAAVSLLKGEQQDPADILGSLLGGSGSGNGGLGDILGSAMDLLGKKK